MSKLEITLDHNDIVESFFENGRLLCIKSDLAGYELINILNRKLDFKFRAAPEHEFQMKLNAVEVWGEDKFGDTYIEFNLFSNHMPPCATTMYLYQNVAHNYHLIPSLRYYNYLLLVFHAELLMFEEDIVPVLSLIPEIESIKEVNIFEVGSIENLMF